MCPCARVPPPPATTNRYQRDTYVLGELVRRRIPTVTVIGGGYIAPGQYDTLGSRHTIIVQAAHDVLAHAGWPHY